MLGVTRERISQLFNKQKLSGYRLGRHVFISIGDINERRHKMENYKKK